MSYKPNSVIYFEGDSSTRVYVLKSGSITLTSTDIETGEELKDRVEPGEFFGVRSALGRYPHEENAVVVRTAQVIVFTVPEFEEYASNNTRVVLKMLKVFSNQLRRIHSKVTNMLDQPSQVNPESGLYQIAEYFHKQKRVRQAYYAFDRYITLYPHGPHVEQAKKLRTQLQARAERYSSEEQKAPAANAISSAGPSEKQTEAGELYYKGLEQFANSDFRGAFRSFQKAAESGDDSEFTVPALVEMGRCLMHLNKPDESIRHLSRLVQKYPRMKELAHVLYYIGRAYEEKGEPDRAGGFFRKVKSLAPGDEELQRQVEHAMQNL